MALLDHEECSPLTRRSPPISYDIICTVHVAPLHEDRSALLDLIDLRG
jgi:hypothetical protein